MTLIKYIEHKTELLVDRFTFVKFLIVSYLLLICLLCLTSCAPKSIVCKECDAENDVINLYCSNCVGELVLEEKEEKKLNSERIDNRDDIVREKMAEDKFDEARNLLKELDETPERTELLNECIYQLAEREYDLERAYGMYRSIMGYKDADEKGHECAYQLAEVETDNKKAYNWYQYIWDYKDSAEKGTERYYKYAVDLISSDWEDAFSIFVELGDYKDAKQNAKEIVKGREDRVYIIAEYAYFKGEYSKAKLYLNYISKLDEAKLLLEYIEMIDEFQGVYFTPDSYLREYIVLEGNLLIFYDFYNGKSYIEEIAIWDCYGSPAIVEVSDLNSKFGVSLRWYPKKEDAELILRELSHNDETIYRKSNTTKAELDRKIRNITPKPQKSEPYIGMTSEQVKASTWGSPSKINKTTYAWGIHEQWVYYGNRYIYLEDGIVTAISE